MRYLVRVYGHSDDLVEIEGSQYGEDEISCYESYVRIWFNDGAIIQISYPKNDKAIWMICLERKGSKAYALEECNDEDVALYSDVYKTEADIVSYAVIHKY